MTTPSVKVIAEIGCNHQGNFAFAEEMIRMAGQFSRVDVVKFQKRSTRELLSEEEFNAPHPNPVHSFGETYGEHREFLEFSVGQHSRLKHTCELWGVEYSASVWDITSAKMIAALHPKSIKIPSAANCNLEMITWLCRQFEGILHVSLGMTTFEEECELINLLRSEDRLRDTVLFSCTSGYPVPFEDLCLGEISRLCDMYGGKTKAIGFSGHHLGIAADIAALALGATCFERHFTLDRTLKGTDHAASLEPDGMRRLARDLRNVAQTLNKKPSDLLPIEREQRRKLKRFSASTQLVTA